MEHIGESLQRQVSRTVSGSPLEPDQPTGELVNPLEAQAKPTGESGSPSAEYKCSICKDAGFVHPMLEVGHPDWGKVIPCKCQAEVIARLKKGRMLRYCSLPADSEGMTFASFRTSPQLQAALDASKAMATGAIRWLCLMGRVDRGKTHLAVAICRARLERGEPAKYAYVPLLLDELRSGYNDDSYQAKMQQFLDVSLLVLDDLGVTKKPSDWAMEKLNTIFDYRYINGKDLVVTMNCPINAIPGDDEGRIGSRLQRIKGGKVIEIEAGEYRLVNHA